MERTKEELKQLAIESLKRPSDFGYHGTLSLFDTWTLGPIIETRDSTLIDQSNSVQIQKIFAESVPEEEYAITHCGHWAVGWVDHLSFLVVYDKESLKTDSPTYSKAFLAWVDIQNRLDQYPLLNEDHYCELEYNATLENIENAVQFCGYDVNLPEDFAALLFSWFWDNKQSAVENHDDNGGYPSDDELKEVFIALDWLAENTD